MADVTITHIGGPTTLIEVEGWRILTDPPFDPPGRTGQNHLWHAIPLKNPCPETWAEILDCCTGSS